MGLILYNTALWFYATGVRLASLFHTKARQWVDGQSDAWKILNECSVINPIWFHCSSVGEFEQGLPMLHQFQKEDANARFLVTFFSPSGYHYAKKRHADLNIAFLPLDSSDNAKKFISAVQPKAAFFIKYEFWFHYLLELHQNNIPTFLISGIFRPSQPFFRWYGSVHRKMLSRFTYFFLQDKQSEDLLHGIDMRCTLVCGDTRFDRVKELKKTDFTNPAIQDFVRDHKVFIAGSIWPSDEPILRIIIDNLPSGWKVILAPHEMNHFNTEWLGEELLYYSQHDPASSARILIIDEMGLLSRLYRWGDLIYIGGGYGKGIHNMLEAAIYEKPIFIGPQHQKFREAIEMLGEGLAFNTGDKAFSTTLTKLIHDDGFIADFKAKSTDYLASQTNVSSQITVFLKTHNYLAESRL